MTQGKKFPSPIDCTAGEHEHLINIILLKRNASQRAPSQRLFTGLVKFNHLGEDRRCAVMQGALILWQTGSQTIPGQELSTETAEIRVDPGIETGNKKGKVVDCREDRTLSIFDYR